MPAVFSSGPGGSVESQTDRLRRRATQTTRGSTAKALRRSRWRKRPTAFHAASVATARAARGRKTAETMIPVKNKAERFHEAEAEFGHREVRIDAETSKIADENSQAMHSES